MKINAMYFTRFLPSYENGGGSRRLLQIHEILKAIYPQLELVAHSRRDRIPEKYHPHLRRMAHIEILGNWASWSTGLYRWSESHRMMVHRLRQFARLWVQSIPEFPPLDIAFMDDPIYYAPLFNKLRQLDVPVVAVCHNLETLAPHQVEKKWARGLFLQELELLSQCHLVITISREETVLLNNFGIRTLYIPYYPVEPIRQRLLEVRHNRLQSAKEGILMVGTTKNLQTRSGVMRAASHWHNHHLHQVAGPLIIGGYKSELYFDPKPYGESVDFRGTLTNEEMDALLSRVNAFLCYQDSGSGSLTRIAEMLIAGVPVLANTHAARSYYNTSGLMELQSLDQLEHLFAQGHIFTGDIPIPPPPDTAYLYSLLNKIGAGN